MRRRDVITILFLVAVMYSAWRYIQPPALEEGQTTISSNVLSDFSRWSGPVAALQPVSSTSTSQSSNGLVKGVSTDQLVAHAADDTTDNSGNFVAPKTLLPVETYHGSPLDDALNQMLKDNNVTVSPEDVVEAFPAPALHLGSVIHVYRATPITVTDWGKTTTYRTWKTNVNDFLTEQSIELGDNDRVAPGGTTALALPSNGSAVVITITRVAVTEVQQKISIPFNKVQKEDPDLPRGQTRVDAGQSGEKVTTYRVTRENGIEVKRELLKTEATKQPKDEVTTIGTKVLIGDSYTGQASWYNYNSTKVASDHFKRGTNLRITNLDNGKQIFVKSDGCICDDSSYVVDLNPDYFKQLGGKISDGVMKHIKVDEILN